jgi:hypothetical protein
VYGTQWLTREPEDFDAFVDRLTRMARIRMTTASWDHSRVPQSPRFSSSCSQDAVTNDSRASAPSLS